MRHRLVVVGRNADPSQKGMLPTPDVAEEDSPSGTISLAELEQIALELNPTLTLAVAEIEKERGNWFQVGRYPNPTLGYVQSEATRFDESHTHGVLVQQTFVTGEKLAKNRDIEGYGIEDARWQHEAQRMRVLTDVRLRYFDVIGAQKQLALVEEIRRLDEENLKAAQALRKGQQVPETDVLQAEVELEQMELALENARADYVSAWRRLAVIVGQPELPIQKLAEPIDTLPELDFEEEWERLLASSPQLRSTEAQVGIAQGQLVRDQATPIPDVTVQIVGDYDRAMDFGTINALVALPVPVFDRNQGQIYSSFQELHRAQTEIERVRLVLRDQLVGTYRDYVQGRNEALRLSENMLPKLQETLNLTRRGYEQGEIDYATVLAIQERYVQTSLRQINAATRARQIAIQIEGLQLTGGLNPAVIGTAIQEGGGGRRAVQQLLENQNQNRLNSFAPAAID